jgi:hypothetical protein
LQMSVARRRLSEKQWTTSNAIPKLLVHERLTLICSEEGVCRLIAGTLAAGMAVNILVGGPLELKLSPRPNLSSDLP